MVGYEWLQGALVSQLFLAVPTMREGEGTPGDQSAIGPANMVWYYFVAIIVAGIGCFTSACSLCRNSIADKVLGSLLQRMLAPAPSLIFWASLLFWALCSAEVMIGWEFHKAMGVLEAAAMWVSFPARSLYTQLLYHCYIWLNYLAVIVLLTFILVIKFSDNLPYFMLGFLVLFPVGIAVIASLPSGTTDSSGTFFLFFGGINAAAFLFFDVLDSAGLLDWLRRRMQITGVLASIAVLNMKARPIPDCLPCHKTTATSLAVIPNATVWKQRHRQSISDATLGNQDHRHLFRNVTVLKANTQWIQNATLREGVCVTNKDNDDLTAKFAPFFKQQIEDALEPLLGPVASVLRSRAQSLQRQRASFLALEEKKLALRREKIQLQHRRGRLQLQQYFRRASSAKPSRLRTRHGLRPRSECI